MHAYTCISIIGSFLFMRVWKSHLEYWIIHGDEKNPENWPKSVLKLMRDWPWVSDSGDCSNLVFLHHRVLHHLYCIPDLSHIIKLFLLQLIPLIIMTNFLRWKPHTHEHYHCNAYKYMYLWKVYKPMKHVEHVFYDLPPFFQLWDSDFQCDLFCLDVVQLFQCRWQPINKQK